MPNVLRPFLSCRVCWRITLAVFTFILAVEAAILVPSARQFERNERQRIADHAQVLLEPLLALSAAASRSPELGGVVGVYGVEGIALYRDDGTQALAAGDAPFPPAGELDMHARAFADPSGAARLVAAWRSTSLPALRVAMRLDASEIAPAVRAYVWRIAGLVLIIVLVVTAGTMLVVNFAVLRPILRLHASSPRAGADPAAAETARVPTRRLDEIGQLIEAHNAMLERISGARASSRGTIRSPGFPTARRSPSTWTASAKAPAPPCSSPTSCSSAPSTPDSARRWATA